MADITGNPTPLNVPSPQDASGTLTPKQGSAANLATAQSTPGVPVGVGATTTAPTVANEAPTPPAVPDLT